MPARVITLYAAGAVQLRKLTSVTGAVLAYSADEIAVESVTNLGEMAKHRIGQLPSVAVDGVVVCAGRVPGVEELRSWVNAAEAV